MNTEEALKFLEKHQPMPGDLDITQEECDLFVSALEHFRKTPDERCIPFFINCVSNSTGLGMYETIGDVLHEQERDKVIECLRSALVSGNNAIKYWCCWWATDINAWDLENLVWPLTKSPDIGLSETAKIFLKLKHENV